MVRWSEIGNILYLEAPVGVGFSSSDDLEDYKKNTDDTTAIDNMLAVVRHFSQYESESVLLLGMLLKVMD